MKPTRLFLISLLTLAATAASAQAPATADAHLDACRSAYEADDLAGSRASAESALALAPDSYPASWMLARVLIDLGNREDDKKVAESFYAEAETNARRAVELAPDDTWGHHYLAAAIGKLALSAGGKRKIELSKEVREEAERALACDPTNDKSHHILGRWNREVAGLSPILKLAAKVVYGGVPKGATREKAVEHFLKAIELNPGHINHHLELGVTYMDMREYQNALDQFAQVAELPEHDPNDGDYKREALLNSEKCEKRIEHKDRDRSR